MGFKSIDDRTANDFCNAIKSYNEWSDKRNSNGFDDLKEMIKDYSPNTTVKAVLIDLTDRLNDAVK